MKRNQLFKATLAFAIAVAVVSCKQVKKDSTAEEMETEEMAEATSEPFFKLSLAQWSMHRMIREDGMNPYLFAEKSKEWGFEGLEYVSGLYYPELEKDDFSAESMQNFIDKSNAEAEKHGMKNLLIMIDGQGNLAAEDATERKEAAENHHKWVDAAAAMGCHSIRVNLNGAQEPEAWVAASVDGLTQLATYAKEKNINIIVENHGGFSSNGEMLAGVMQQVGMDNCGTLPDFGNFCMKWAEWPECDEWYDRYKGTKELMPFAKAVSAKAMDFDENGNEINTDYAQMLQIVKDAGYSGYIGVEYEGRTLSEEAGIIATRDLLINAAKSL